MKKRILKKARKPSGLKTYMSSQTLLYTVVGVLALTGAALIGNGIWIKVKAEMAQVLLNQAFERVQIANSNRGLHDTNIGSSAKPWAWADMEPVARINVPSISKSAIVLNNVSGEALAFGPGHMANTPEPGARGTSVIAAHRDTHFSWIGQLKKGDEIEITRKDGSVARFVMRRSWVAHYKNPGIDADSDERLLALSTCYPFDTKNPGPMRYVVEAELMETQTVAGLE